MGRTLAFVFAALALAGAVYFVMADEEVADRGGLVDEGLPTGDEEPAGPVLEAKGREAAPQPTGPLRFEISGLVLGEDGKPAADIRVAVRRAGPAQDPTDPSTWRTTADERIRRTMTRLEKPYATLGPVAAEVETDGEGRFALKLAEAGSYRVTAQPVPPQVGTYAMVSVYETKLEERTTLYVLPGSALTGRVLDTADGPVAATLTGSWWSSGGGTNRIWNSEPVNSAAGDGAFRFDAVPQGRVRVDLLLPGGRRLTGIHVETPHEGEFVIRVPSSGGTLQGTISDAEGGGIAGAAVVFTTQSEKKKGSTSGGAIQTKAVTDAQGRYRVDDAPLGRITGVQALAEGFLPHMERAADLEAQRRVVEPDKPLTLDLTLNRGGAVRGRVTDQETGAAIPGATVHLHAVSLGRAGNAEPPRSVVADANGRYRFDAVGIGRYVTLPSADGYYLPQLKPQGGAVGGIVSMPMGPGASAPPAVTVVMTAEGLEVERDLALAKGHRVAGSVVDADGQGVRGAEVFARGYGLQSIGWQWGLGGLRREPLATSGSGGRFTIEGLPPKGDWVLYAKKDGYAGVFAKPFAVDEDTKAADVTLKLEPGATVRGRVVDEDGRGVTAVTVGYWGGTQETAGGRNSAQTDAEGRFELKGMPAGDFTLNVRVPGSRGKQHPLKDLKAGEVREGIVLELAAGVEVSGVIVDKDGEPVTGLMLLLQSLGGVSSWNQTMTSRNGTFSFNAASAGRVQLMTWTGGQQTRLGEPFNAPATNVRLVYERLPTIMLRGEVQRPDGTPVPLASVRVQGAPTNGPIAMDMSGMGGTDAVNGAFERAVTGKGPWSVVATAARDEQGRPLNLQPKTVKVTDPAERIIVKLERGLEVAGVVVDDEGKGIAGVTVTAKSRTQTNAQGRFRIGGLGKGKIQVAVMPPSGFVRPPTQNVEAGTTDLRFELVEGLAITGTAYAPDGKPVAQGFVSGTWNDAAGARRGNASTRIQSDGKFRLGGIPRGVLVRLQVQIWDPTAGASVAPKVIEDVRPGTTELEVRLGGGLTIEGTVLGTDGKPAENCWVYGRAVEGGQDTGWVQVGSDGSWKLTGLKPGRYSIQVMRMGGQAAPAPMEVDAPARGVRIQLPKTASLAGRITGISTEGQRWIVILRDEAGQHIASAIVQPDGSWRASTVREGANVWVHASSSTSDRYVRHGPVQAGREDIATAARTGKAITGLLEGLPEGSRGMVWAEGERGWRSSGTVGQDGTFTIRGVPPGGYVVKARTTNSSHDGETRGVTDGAKDVRVLMNPRAAR